MRMMILPTAPIMRRHEQVFRRAFEKRMSPTMLGHFVIWCLSQDQEGSGADLQVFSETFAEYLHESGYGLEGVDTNYELAESEWEELTLALFELYALVYNYRDTICDPGLPKAFVSGLSQHSWLGMDMVVNVEVSKMAPTWTYNGQVQYGDSV